MVLFFVKLILSPWLATATTVPSEKNAMSTIGFYKVVLCFSSLLHRSMARGVHDREGFYCPAELPKVDKEIMREKLRNQTGKIK